MHAALARVILFVMLLAMVSCGTRREVVKTGHVTGTAVTVDSSLMRSIFQRLHTLDTSFGLDMAMTVDWIIAPDSVTPVPARISMTTTGKVSSRETDTEIRDSGCVSVNETHVEVTDTLQELERNSGSAAVQKESRAGRVSLFLSLLVILVIALCVLRVLSIRN